VTSSSPEISDLVTCGSLELWDQKLDRLSPKVPANLTTYDKREFFNVTTSNDPVIQRLASQKTGNVYATDTVLSVLMATKKSVNSWDIVVRKEGGCLYLDKRPNSRIDFWTVNENWNEVQQQDKESNNHPSALAAEATVIGQNFSQQSVLSKETHKFEEANPFIDSDAAVKGNVAVSVGYRYRLISFGESIKLVARCQLNSFTKDKSDKPVFLTVRALNEFDPKLSGNVDWRQKLESQPGAVLATEMKNNANKLARWTSEMLLAGADEIRLGFVSRTNPKNATKHQLLKVLSFKPPQFVAAVGVKVPALWGSLKLILNELLSEDLGDGMYLLFKDPNKGELKIFSIPDNAFEMEDPESQEQS